MGDNNQDLVILLALCFATLSLLASLLTLLLIRRLNKWNGYMQLVVSLTCCQIVYDIGFYPLIWFNHVEGKIAYIALNTWGGLTSTLWSNVIILVTCRIVVELRTIDIVKRCRYYYFAVYVPSTVMAVLSSIMLGNVCLTVTYFLLRSLSIIVNVLAIVIIFFKINTMRKNGDSFSVSAKTNPVFVLSLRLVYYCAVQTITRIGNSWYQLQYGFGGGYDADSASALEKSLYLSEFILTPSAGIGYLVVFLCIQPEAYKELRRMVWGGESWSGKGEGVGKGLGKGLDTTSDTMDHTVIGDMSSAGGLSEVLLGDSEGDSGRSSSSNKQRDSSRESLFPLLEMDEDGLAREIDRIYAYTHMMATTDITKF